MLSMNGFVMTLTGLAGFTVLFGRFFCGYVCAFGTFGDAVYALSGLIQKKVFKRKKQISFPDKAVPFLQKIKYILLFLIVILSDAGIYGSLKGVIPKETQGHKSLRFSKLTAFKLPDGEQLIGIILLILIIIGMALQKRFFCQFLCPMGAVFAMLPIMPFSAIRSNKDSCLKGCSACRKNCPVCIKPGDDKFRDGEFRKRVQFMYDGELMRVKFRYFGDSVEHVLDRLPTAKANKRDTGVYDVSAEVYGYGILIWLLSQGSQVDVIAPKDLRDEWLEIAEQIVNRDYNGWEDVAWKG